MRTTLNHHHQCRPNNRNRFGGAEASFLTVLERRVLLSGYTTLASLPDVPPLESLYGSPHTLFLDFNGDPAREWRKEKDSVYQVPATPAYSVDGDPKTFSDQELSNIKTIWSIVAELYRPFNVNVTTVDPQSYGEAAAAKIVIGGKVSDWYKDEGALGVAPIGGFYNELSNVGYAFSDTIKDPKDPASLPILGKAIAHEAGHLFGLAHQSVWSQDQVFLYSPLIFPFRLAYELLQQYNDNNVSTVGDGKDNYKAPPLEPYVSPLMGIPYYGRATWWMGTNERGRDEEPWPTSFGQKYYADTVSVVSDVVELAAGPPNSGSYRGLGFRPNDEGSAINTAVALQLKNGRWNYQSSDSELGRSNGLLKKSVIQNSADIDYFSFSLASGGHVKFDVELPTVGRTLDAIFELRDANGKVIDRPADGKYQTVYKINSATGTLEKSTSYTPATLSRDLGPGTYYLSVHGHGIRAQQNGSSYDLGSYTLSGTFTPEEGNAEGAVKPPTISPSGGNFNQSVIVTLASPTAEATIRYTLDGSDPSVTSTIYTGPITVQSSATLKCRAFVDGSAPSAVSKAEFAIGNNTGSDAGAASVAADGLLQLNIGSRASLREGGVDGDDWVLIRHVAGSPTGQGGETIAITLSGGKARASSVTLEESTKLYTGVRYISADAGMGNDSVLIDATVQSTFYIEGGSGNDNIVYLGGADVTIQGGAGDDTLTGGSGDDSISGDDGDDTISDSGGSNALFGGSDNDNITGGSNADYIDAGSGDDTANGGGGDDVLLGGAGGDDLHGDSGSDHLEGGDDADTLSGDDGNDVVSGGSGNDRIHTGADNDLAFGDAGADTLFGDAGDDNLSGGSGDDSIEGNAGNDVIAGDEGNDKLIGGSSTVLAPDGNDSIDGGSGDDQIIGDDGIIDDVTLAGGSGNDTLNGGVGNDAIYGQGGDDSISGGDGADYLEGDAGNDTIHGDNDADRIIGGASTVVASDGNDSLDGGSGDDIILGDDGVISPSGDVTLTSGAGGDTIHGNGGADLVYGQGGNDSISGDADNDTLFGNAGADTMTGNDGADLMSGGDDNDLMAGNDGDDTLSGNAGADTMSGDAGADLMSGNEDNDSMAGNDGNDSMFGNAGNDSMTGDAGDDDMIGGDGADTLFGGTGVDVLLGDNGTITTSVNLVPETSSKLRTVTFASSSSAGADSLSGGDDADYLYGQESNDTMSGDGGMDYMEGNEGADSMSGGADDDDIIGGSTVASAADSGDTIDGGSGNDVILGDNGVVTRSTTSDGKNFIRYITTGLHNSAVVRSITLLGEGVAGASGNDSMSGAAGDDSMWGQDGPDTMFGNDGDDDMIGNLGADLMNGNAGDDGMIGDNGTIVNELLDGTNAATIATQGNHASAKINISGTKKRFITLLNSSTGGNDTMLGGAGNDSVHAGAGADLLQGDDPDNNGQGDGNDALFGDLGNDTINGGGGGDHLWGGAGNDRLDGQSGDDTSYGGDGDDSLYADQKGDRLMDWFGNFNNFYVPWPSYGAQVILRSPAPQTRQFLLDLANADGATDANGECEVVVPPSPGNAGPGGRSR